MEHILDALTKWISGVYGTLGYWGIVLFMGIESACIPLPSEVIMPVAGTSWLSHLWAASISTFGGRV